MTRNRQWIVLSLSLLLLGGLLMAYKVVRLGFPLMSNDSSEQWVVQARLEVEPLEGPVRAGLLLPAQLGRLIRPDAMLRMKRGGLRHCLKAEAVSFVLDTTSVFSLLAALPKGERRAVRAAAESLLRIAT